MVEYNIAVDSKELADNLRRWEREMPGLIQTVFNAFGGEIAARSNERAHRVLNVITGRLSTSILHHADPDQLVISAKTAVKYAAVHEYGFQGVVSVSAHTRGRSSVRAHSRRMNIEARPFVKPSIDDFFMGRRAEIIAGSVFQTYARRMGFE